MAIRAWAISRCLSFKPLASSIAKANCWLFLLTGSCFFFAGSCFFLTTLGNGAGWLFCINSSSCFCLMASCKSVGKPSNKNSLVCPLRPLLFTSSYCQHSRLAFASMAWRVRGKLSNPISTNSVEENKLFITFT